MFITRDSAECDIFTQHFYHLSPNSYGVHNMAWIFDQLTRFWAAFVSKQSKISGIFMNIVIVYDWPACTCMSFPNFMHFGLRFYAPRRSPMSMWGPLKRAGKLAKSSITHPTLSYCVKIWYASDMLKRSTTGTTSGGLKLQCIAITTFFTFIYVIDYLLDTSCTL